MALELSSLDASKLKLQGTLLREERRSPISLLDANIDRTHEFVTI